MSTRIAVEAARIPDRDRFLRELRDAGLDARPVGEVRIEVPAAADGSNPMDGLDGEELVVAIGDPFVPVRHEGVIYIRPPIG